MMELPWSPVRSSSPHNPPASCPSSPASVEQNLVSPSPQEAGQAGDPGCGGDRRAIAAASSFLSYDNSQGETLLLEDPLNLLVEPRTVL